VLIKIFAGDDAILLTYDNLPTTAQTPITALDTFEEAHSSMTIYLHEFILFLNSIDSSIRRNIYDLQTIVNKHTALRDRHIAWCKAFDVLLEQGPIASASDVAKLQVWRTLVDMTLELDIALGEMAWDGKIETFRKVVSFVEIVIEEQPKGRATSSGTKMTSTYVSGPYMPGMSPISQHEDATPSEPSPLSFPETDYCQSVTSSKPIFSLDLGIITPLYVVVSRCRDPAIRRRGLQLLASCNRREGIWDSTLTARVAERIIAIEESGATSHPVIYANQIPERARIRELTTKFGIDCQGLIRYTKSVDCVGVNDKYEELLEW
jgi:hypothetical protein